MCIRDSTRRGLRRARRAYRYTCRWTDCVRDVSIYAHQDRRQGRRFARYFVRHACAPILFCWPDEYLLLPRLRFYSLSNAQFVSAVDRRAVYKTRPLLGSIPSRSVFHIMVGTFYSARRSKREPSLKRAPFFTFSVCKGIVTAAPPFEKANRRRESTAVSRLRILPPA